MDLELIKREIGAKIKLYRAKHNLTQEKFCEIVDMEQSGLSNIENAKTYPHFISICSLIERGGIEPNYLFDFLNKNNSKKLKGVDEEIIELLQEIPNSTKEQIVGILRAIVKK